MQNSSLLSRRASQLLVLGGFMCISSLLLIGTSFVALPIALTIPLPGTSPHNSHYLTLGWQPRCGFLLLLAGGILLIRAGVLARKSDSRTKRHQPPSQFRPPPHE